MVFQLVYAEAQILRQYSAFFAGTGCSGSGSDLAADMAGRPAAYFPEICLKRGSSVRQSIRYRRIIQHLRCRIDISANAISGRLCDRLRGEYSGRIKFAILDPGSAHRGAPAIFRSSQSRMAVQ